MTGFVKRRTGHLTLLGVLLAIVLGAALLAARSTRTAAQASPPPPPEVAVIQGTGEDVDVYREYPARTYARDFVEVRGRVDGYRMSGRYNQSYFIKEGAQS